MYFSLMLGRVLLTCDSFALVAWTSTPKGGSHVKTQKLVQKLVQNCIANTKTTLLDFELVTPSLCHPGQLGDHSGFISGLKS